MRAQRIVRESLAVRVDHRVVLLKQLGSRAIARSMGRVLYTTCNFRSTLVTIMVVRNLVTDSN